MSFAHLVMPSKEIGIDMTELRKGLLKQDILVYHVNDPEHKECRTIVISVYWIFFFNVSLGITEH